MMRSGDVWVAGRSEAHAAAELLCAFNAEFRSPCPPMEQLIVRLRWIIEGGQGFVLLGGNRAAPGGFALVTLRPSVYADGPLAVVDELYVRPRLRNRKLGSALMSGIVTEVRRRSGFEIHINVDEIDIDARRFYERHGFTNIQPGEDHRMLCYLRELSEG